MTKTEREIYGKMKAIYEQRSDDAWKVKRLIEGLPESQSKTKQLRLINAELIDTEKQRLEYETLAEKLFLL